MHDQPGPGPADDRTQTTLQAADWGARIGQLLRL
jgi:hypothetical protein